MSIENKEKHNNAPTLKKRVLFVITQSELGGAQRFLVNLIKNLDKQKYELLVAAGQDGGKGIRSEVELAGAKFYILKHARRGISPILDWLVTRELRRLVKEIRPDTVFLNSSKTTAWGPLALNFPTELTPWPKVVYRIGGWSFNDPQPFWVRWLLILLEKIFAKQKDVIIVNNRHDLEQAKKFRITPRHKLELIYNGIDPYKLELLNPDEARIRLYEKLPADQKHASLLQGGVIIGTIANFYKTKGLEYLIEAMHTLNTKYKSLNTILVIIGDGQEHEGLVSSIKYYGLGNNILLAGRLLDAHKYLPAFDIFVLPSVKEGFPWALLEAMSAKVSVIATAVGAVPEVIENQKNGLLVPPADPQALAKAIAQLASNESLRRELAIQAHQTVIHRFGLSKMIQKIEDIL